MLKKELEELVKKQAARIEELEGQIADFDGFYTELECKNAELQNKLNNTQNESINDLDCFKYKLESDHLMSEELESFIENYMRYYN